jgi:hypothetical protein
MIWKGGGVVGGGVVGETDVNRKFPAGENLGSTVRYVLITACQYGILLPHLVS